MKWEAALIKHKNKNRIAVYFEKNAEWNNRIKKLKGVQWSQTLKAWHLPDNEEYRKKFKIELPVKKEQELLHLQKKEQFTRWLKSKRYSPNTIKTYCDALLVFLRHFDHKPISAINNADIIDFNNDFILKNKLSASYQNQVVNAIKLYFAKIEHTSLNFDLVHRPKREKMLPNVLSKQEIKLILEAHQNLKHRAMLSLLYACGLRRSELLQLVLQDVDSKRNLLIVRQAKGKKDRVVPLPESMIYMLREYFKHYKPEKYLFEGQTGATYSEKSLESVLKQAVKKANIKKPVSLHWLRHSYATHLLENGTDLRYIQEILGHSSSKTTEIYTHVSTKNIQNIISPYDTL